MRDVILIPQEQLQRVLTGRQGDFRFGLGVAKMQMIEIVGNRIVHRRQFGINQQVVVSGVWAIDARTSQFHAAQSKTNCKLGWDSRPILKIDEKNCCASRRWSRPATGSHLTESYADCGKADRERE